MNSNILHWFETILEERFGQKFQLLFNEIDIQIKYEDELKYVSVSHCGDFYKIPSKIKNCFEWDYESGKFGQTLDGNLPSPSNSKLASPLIIVGDDSSEIKFDVFGLIFWMLNRIEEITPEKTDNHNRFSAVDSHSYKYQYLERPIVDEWLHILSEVIVKTWPDLKLKENEFKINISHDVDQPSRYAFRSFKAFARELGVDVLRNRKFINIFTAPLIYFGTNKNLLKLDEANTFKWIMDVSEKNNLKSAFYFICGKSHPMNDADYDIEHPAMRKLMSDIHSRGHEIGLHPSYNCYQDEERFLSEANLLKKVCDEEKIPLKKFGGRMHFLRWTHPLTLKTCQKANMAYDSTLGFSDMAGFRCGTCFEYPAFDPVESKQLTIRIRPLIVMDCTVTADRYMKLSLEQALEKILALKNSCRKVNGQFTALWHNTEFSNKETRNLYEEVLSR